MLISSDIARHWDIKCVVNCGYLHWKRGVIMTLKIWVSTICAHSHRTSSYVDGMSCQRYWHAPLKKVQEKYILHALVPSWQSWLSISWMIAGMSVFVSVVDPSARCCHYSNSVSVALVSASWHLFTFFLVLPCFNGKAYIMKDSTNNCYVTLSTNLPMPILTTHAQYQFPNYCHFSFVCPQAIPCVLIKLQGCNTPHHVQLPH